jgi:hypothetical protein
LLLCEEEEQEEEEEKKKAIEAQNEKRLSAPGRLQEKVFCESQSCGFCPS